MLKKIIISLFIFILTVWAGVWLLSPPLARWVAADFLHQYDLTIEKSSSVRVNLLLLKVTISDLALSKQGESTLALDELVVDLAFWPLLTKQLRVEALTLTGLNSVVSKVGNQLAVAGFILPDSSVAEETTSVSNSTQSSSLKVFIPNVHLQNSSIMLHYENAQYNLQLHDITLSNLEIDANNITLQTSLQAGINGARLSAQTSMHKAGEAIDISSHITISDFDLADTYSLVTQAPHYAGLVDIELQADANLKNQDISLTLKDSSVALRNIEYNDQQFSAMGSSVLLDINRVAAEMKQATLTHASGVFDLNAELLSVNLAEDQSTLASFDSLAVEQISVSHDENNSNLAVAKVAIQNLLASHVQQPPETAPLLSLKEVSMTQIEADNRGIKIEELLLQQPELQVSINQNGELENLVSMSNTSSVENPEPTEQNPEIENNDSEQGYTFEINHIAVVDSASIHFSDASVAPAFEKTVEIAQLDITDISNADIQQALSFILKAKDDEFLSIDIHGKAQPFGELVNLNLEGNIKELPLPQVSVYTSEYIGFGVKKGQMNTDLVINVVDSIIDGKTVIYLNGAEFGNSDPVDTSSVLNQGSVPLNLALNMLKDGDGNIKLTVPMSGNVDDPSFGVQHIVGLIMQKAALNQAKSYLMNTFVPYAKVVSVAVAAGSYALKIRFEDLPYAPGEVTVGPDQQEYAQQLTSLMQDNGKVIVHVCPVVTPSEPLPEESQSASAEEKQKALLALANTRATNFKRFVVEQGAIESNRLLICSPEIDSSEAGLPHISLNVQ